MPEIIEHTEEWHTDHRGQRVLTCTPSPGIWYDPPEVEHFEYYFIAKHGADYTDFIYKPKEVST